MTNPQIRLIKMAVRQLGIDDADYRTALRSIAGVDSCKDLTEVGFEDVLAWLESCGWRDKDRSATHWRDLQANRSRFASSRQLHAIYDLAQEMDPPLLAGMVRRMSGNRVDQPSKLRPAEAYNLIEALKAMRSRKPAAG